MSSFSWRRRRDSQGSALRLLRKHRLCSASPREFESLSLKSVYVKQKDTLLDVFFFMAQKERLARLCLAFATQTPIVFGFAEGVRVSLVKDSLYKTKRHPFGCLLFHGAEGETRKALPCVCYANTDYVRLRRGSSSLSR